MAEISYFCGNKKERNNFFLFTFYAEIAQLVEQWIEAPRVIGSNPILGIVFSFALLVQLVERRSPKSDDVGSSPPKRALRETLPLNSYQLVT